jgi:hypothetical protein
MLLGVMVSEQTFRVSPSACHAFLSLVDDSRPPAADGGDLSPLSMSHSARHTDGYLDCL